MEDRKLEDRIGNLKEIIFFRNAEIFIKELKEYKINVFISGKVNLDLKKFYKYLILSNVDLTCELVKEFPRKSWWILCSLENFK